MAANDTERLRALAGAWRNRAVTLAPGMGARIAYQICADELVAALASRAPRHNGGAVDACNCPAHGRPGRAHAPNCPMRESADEIRQLADWIADRSATIDRLRPERIAGLLRRLAALAAESRADGRVEDACDCPAAGRPSRAHAPNCPMRAPSPAREAATAGGDNSANLHKDRRDKSPDLQKDGWIACSERLPPDGVTVLGYVQGAGDPYFCTIRANVIASMLAADDRRERGRPTHWMPLPAAPTAPDATGGAE